MANNSYKQYLHDKYVKNNAGSQSGQSSGSPAYSAANSNAENSNIQQRKPLLQELDEKYGVKRDPSAYTHEGGAFGAAYGGYIKGDDGQTYMHDYSKNRELMDYRKEIWQQRPEAEQYLQDLVAQGYYPYSTHFQEIAKEYGISGTRQKQLIEQGRELARQGQQAYNPEERKSFLSSSPYAEYLSREDFDQYSKAGSSKIKMFGGDQLYDYINNIGNFQTKQNAQMRAGDWYKYTFMTDEEKGVYNYIYEKEGKKAAEKFLAGLDESLGKEEYHTVYKPVANMAKDSGVGGRIAASALTVAAEPVRTVSSFMALAQDAYGAVSGKDINPYSNLRRGSMLTQDIRQGIGSKQGKVGNFLYNTVMSAADSAMNMVMGGALAKGFGLTGKALLKATNVIGSALMSSEVASMSVAEGKEKGYSDAGAFAVGLVRGAVEYASEAIGGEWVIRRIQENPLNFVISMFLNMVPEGTEEVMSDAMNGVINLGMDRFFGTEESGIPKLVKHFQEKGTDWQKANPELATVFSILGDEGVSFLGGSLATVGSSGVQAYNMRYSIQETAREMNTTPESVVQFMTDHKLEDPNAVLIMAQLYDAGSLDDLRAKVSDTKDAQAIVDEAMRGQAQDLEQEEIEGAPANPSAYQAPEYASIDEFSREFYNPESVSEIYGQTPETDLNEFASGFRRAYDMGQSGVSANYATEENTPGLNEQQRTAAFELGRQAAQAKAADQAEKVQQKQKSGELQRVQGTVKGENVSMDEITRPIYRLLSYYAKTTGANVVLYKSQADENGNFPSEEGRFQWKDDTIYIDMNAGLGNVKNEGDVGRYVMLRTFNHEFTHFIEKWNAKEYNSFREYVFSVMESRGENVHDRIEEMQARDKSGKMTYEQASREVIADSMMDIMRDSTLVQQLAQENPNVFRQLLNKLRDFAARIRQAYRHMTASAPREARALQENGRYIDDILQQWEAIAKGAVKNYQGAKGEELVNQPAKPENLPKQQIAGKKEKSSKQAVSEQVEASPKQVEASKTEPETRRVGMEFFKPVESTEEKAPDLKSMVKKAPKEAGEEKPAAVEEKAAPVEKAPAPAVEKKDTPEGAKLRAQLDAFDSVDLNGFRYSVFGMKNTTLDLNEGSTSTGTEYWGTIARISGENVPVQNGRTIFNRAFPTREEAVDYMVSVAENNNLLKGADINGATESKAPDVGAETDADRNGNGAVRVSPELQEGSVPGEAAGREPASVPAKVRDRTGRNGDRADAERNGRSGSEGAGESGVQSGRSELTPQEKETQQKETRTVVEHDVEEKSTVHEGGNNYVIGESLDLPKGEKARYKANVEAIRLAKTLEAENRIATPEEQAVLAKYVGWGGLADAFNKSKSAWSKEYAELKELLTEDEYRAASGSTLNAHYTSIPVIKAMYAGLKKLGFKGGRMLEPSSGVGNFVGAMPTDMSAGVKSWTMVELDKITGLIAKHLYPQADVRIEGFEKAIIPDNFIDVAIGNVPFGNYEIVDRAYPKQVKSAIHNYFFAKSLDKVRPGGIVMFITSSYTMNSRDSAVRRYIAKKADLLGAIRLPNNAFSDNAGTSVVTDILVLRKREPGTPYNGVPFEAADYDWQLGGTYQNEYFKAHPEMVLGEQVTGRGMYRNNEYTVNPFTDQGTLQEQIEKAFDGIEVVGSMEYPAARTPEQTNQAVARAEKKPKSGGYVNQDGKLYQNDNGTLKEVKTDEKTAKRIKGMLQIRTLSRELMNAQMQAQPDNTIANLRKALNKAYDSFVKENGYLNSQANKKAFETDPDRFSLLALENWNSEKKTATKADIFTENTVRPNKTITHVDSVEEGVIVSRNTTGGIDVPLISRLTGRSEADVTRELIESEQAFKDRDGNLVPAEMYLSGNVRAKLREAQGMVGLDKDYQHNVDALQQIVPADIPHEAIFVQPGAPWIPDNVYADFAAYMIGGNNYRSYGGPDILIHRSNETGNFTVELKNQRLKSQYLNTQKWGTSSRSFLNLLDAMMNSRSVTVSRKGADGKSYVDNVATAAANAKVEEIRNEFQKWLWQDEERTRDLEYLYNETFNALVTPAYDGGNLTVNGLRAGWSLKPHQANAVQRIISSGGNTLLAHRVGAGKTMEMAAAAMKLKELGIVKKPMFAVPKSLVAQWGKEFTSYFPTARLLVAEQGDFTPANRKTFANRIATGNYDAVIVSYEQFEKIPMSDDFTLKMYRKQVDEIVLAIEEQRAESGQKSLSVKDLEKKRKQLDTKIQKLTDKPKDADSIEFEQLGIDSIFVDEAHNFKNLWYTTSMNNVAGLGNKDGSKRAFDLYTKVRYLQQLNGGRGVVFATATPVMNSMSEMYIMQKYLQQDLLDQLGLSTFDAWAKQFGEVVNAVEIQPSGQGFRVKQKFSRFKNVGELQQLFRNFADVLTKIPDLKIPKMRGGKVITVESEPSEFQKNYMKELQKRADTVKNVDPRKDNMLKITSDGRKISYTQRMIDPSLPYEEGCKIYMCADNVVEEYKNSKDIKGTQIIFMDMATPKGKTNSEKAVQEEDTVDEESAKLYEDLKARLVKKGIPAKEIAFIHDADTDAKKSKLFDDVNDGKVRVLIGSTGKMGVGMNAQKRIVAIHHVDAPWRPGDVEQRDGRAFRQKNMNDEVAKYVYVTKGSFDARLWDILGFKQNFIDQIMNGENVGREVEDTGEVTLSAAEIKAIASGNHMIIEQVELDTDIKRLENLYMAHNAAKIEAKSRLAKAKQQKAETEQRVEKAKTDLKNRGSGYEDENFSITIGKQSFTDKKAAGEALMAAATAKANKEKYTKIGSFAGFDIQAIETNEGLKGLLTGAQGYSFPFYPEQTTRMINRMQAIVKDLGSYITQQQDKLADINKEIKGQEEQLQQPFAQQQELDTKRARYNEIMDILNPKQEQEIAESEDEDRVEYSLRREESEPRIKQEFSSAATSLNQVAALFKSKAVDFGDINIDIGGGAYNATTEYLAERGTTNMVFDPYNRGSEENLATLDFLRAGNRADTATCANVLNVIKEAEARRNVILETAKAIKEDGAAYFSVYEKDKSGQGRQTGADQWQNSRSTADYVQEIEEFFDNVERKGSVIIATDPKPDLPAAFWRITEEQEIEYANRRESLSNREVLKMAADEIDPATLSDAEKNALDMFQTRLTRLEEAQEQRAELGRQYKEQQFTKGGSRSEADKTRNRMKVYDERIQRLENDLISLENKDVLRRVLKEARNIIETQERKRGDETLKRYRERRNESLNTRKYREKVRADAETLRKWLVNPSNKNVKKHVPVEIQKTVADFLESINLSSKTALRTSGLETTKADEKYLKNMRKLHDAIRENIDTHDIYSGFVGLPENFLENFEAIIRKTEQHMEENSGVFVVNQMSAKELRELHQVLKTLKKYITTINVLHNNAMFAHADEAGENTTQHLSKFKKSTKSGAAYKFLRFDYMRPSIAFEHFGEGGKSIEHEFREGQATLSFLADEIIDFAKKTFTGEEVKEWSKEVKEFKLSDGKTIRLPVADIMSFLELTKRPQALTHIYGGGVRASNFKEKGKIQLDDGHTLTMEDVQKMLDSLTPRQREVADKLQQFMRGPCAEWGNYVSRIRFDVDQFTDPNYFPINSDGRYLPTTADETPDNAGLYALLNMGFTKELKENADNRIILYNIFDVFANHTASMAQYRAFALPVLDALKWFNYKNDSTSVRDEMARAFGAPEESRAGSGSKGYAESFVLNLIRSLNGTAAQGDPYDSFGLKALHRFNRAAIAYNLRVFVQQPLAITRAAMLINPRRLMQGFGMSAVQMKKLAEEMETHSGIASWKNKGFYDTNVSRGLTDLIKQNPSFSDRVTEVGTKLPEFADRFTWAAMWYAAKKSVNRSKYATEEAYFKAVTEKFEDVIYKTQVVDSVLTKSEFLRAKGFFPRTLGAFMSEPMTTISMLADAHYKYTDDIQQGMSRAEAWRKNGKNITKTVAVYAVGQILLAAAQAVMDAWRDDDEYDTENWFSNYFQKYLNAFKANMVEELLPFGKIPLVSELYEAMKGLMDYAGLFDKLGLDLYGNDISNGWAQYAKYLQKAAEITLDLSGVTGNNTNYTWYGAIYNLLRGAAGLTGYPIATAWREIQDLWNNTVGYSAPSLKLDTYERKIDRIYKTSIRQTGLSMKDYERILDEIDTDGSGSISQSETWPYLVKQIEGGKLTKEQAEAIWNAKEWNTSFDDAISGYQDYTKPLGISVDKYAEILAEADVNDNASVTQDELGAYLVSEIKNGTITEDQADALWKSLWHKEKSKTFDKWRSSQGAATKAETPTTPTAPTSKGKTTTATKVSTSTLSPAATLTPTTVPTQTVDTWEAFKSSAPVWSENKEEAYQYWQNEVQPRGVSLDQYTNYLKAADTNNDSSVNQNEFGAVLYGAVQRKEIDMDTANAIWRTLWHKPRSKTFTKWLNG